MERWTDELMDGWTMERRKRIREILSIPLSLYSPQPSSLLNSQSRRGTAVPSTMCCGSSDAKPVLGQPLLFLVLFLLPASLTGFPSCIPAPSYPLILRLLVFLTISLPCFRLYCFPLSILNLGEGHPCSSPSTLAYSGLTS